MSYCRCCGEEIDFIWTKEERYRAVDPDPVFVIEGENGEDFIQDEGEIITGRTAEKWEETMELPDAFVPHWRTCKSRIRRPGERWR